MTDQELTRLLTDLESDRVERKGSASDMAKICEAVCSFANDLPGHRKPGVLFVGVNDDGSCSDLPIIDQWLLTLGDIRSNGNIVPLPQMIVGKRTLSGCDMAVIIVQPSAAPPIRYKGRTCIRVGPRRAYATPEEEKRLSERRRFADLPFDVLPLDSASVDDLDLNLFQQTYLPSAIAKEVLDENQRSVEEQLSSLRFLSPGEPRKPTVLGILVAGKDPRTFLPGAYVQFLRLDGEELVDPIKDQKDIDGPLPHLVATLEEVLRINIATATDVNSEAIEVKHPDYPLAALRQLVRNAILHRAYDGTNAPVRVYWFNDRIEIHSPGGLYGQVTRENFGNPGITDYRNPHLAEAMKNLGYVQRFGMGLEIARNELEKNGNPPPEFDIQATNILVTVRRAL